MRSRIFFLFLLLFANQSLAEDRAICIAQDQNPVFTEGQLDFFIGVKNKILRSIVFPELNASSAYKAPEKVDVVSGANSLGFQEDSASEIYKSSVPLSTEGFEVQAKKIQDLLYGDLYILKQLHMSGLIDQDQKQNSLLLKADNDFQFKPIVIDHEVALNLITGLGFKSRFDTQDGVAFHSSSLESRVGVVLERLFGDTSEKSSSRFVPRFSKFQFSTGLGPRFTPSSIENGGALPSVSLFGLVELSM